MLFRSHIKFSLKVTQWYLDPQLSFQVTKNQKQIGTSTTQKDHRRMSTIVKCAIRKVDSNCSVNSAGGVHNAVNVELFYNNTGITVQGTNNLETGQEQ